MPVTQVPIANIGSPIDDPALSLPGNLAIPDPIVHLPPWPSVVVTYADHFKTADGLNPFNVCSDCAGAGILALGFRCRVTNQIPGQTTSGRWHQQTDDMKIAIRAMRNDPFGLGYLVTGFVGSIGGSGAGHHSLYAAIDGTQYDDKSDGSVLLSPVTDFSDRSVTVLADFINAVQTYGNSTDIPTLLSESPIALATLGESNPILHYNGNAESPGMSITQQTRFANAKAVAGGSGYTSITNTGALGVLHSYHTWSALSADSITWLLGVIAAWVPPGPAPGPEPEPTPSPGGATQIVIMPMTRRLGTHLVTGRSYPYRNFGM